MTTVTTVKKHAFLTPAHNAWYQWTCEGQASITNPGTSHRVLESLSYAIDLMVNDGWRIEQIFVDAGGTPNLLFLSRDEPVSGE